MDTPRAASAVRGVFDGPIKMKGKNRPSLLLCARTPGQALGPRAPVQQLEDTLDAGLHVAGRVLGGGAVPP